MTKKRFKETISTGIVTDIVTGKEYRCEMRIDDTLLELLNQLSDENEQLQKDCIALIYNNQEYRKENEQLKSEIENLKITIDARDILIEVCEKKFRELGLIISVDDDGYVIE